MSYVIYEKKVERDLTENLFSKYEIQKPKRINRSYEYRKQISQILNTDIDQIFGETKGFSEADLNGIIKDIESYVQTWKKDPAPRCRNLVNEVKAKRKLSKENLLNK